MGSEKFERRVKLGLMCLAVWEAMRNVEQLLTSVCLNTFHIL